MRNIHLPSLLEDDYGWDGIHLRVTMERKTDDDENH